jgi:NitT/TauT family transport system ATP-binding protein
MIEVKDLSKRFQDGDPILQGISFSMSRGETLSVIGPSGCGKTTLLYILAGLKQPSTGVARHVGGANGTPSRTAFIFQDYGLFPWKTAAQNVGLAMKIRKTPLRTYRHKTHTLLEELDLTHVAHLYPSQLSGGQQQRVAIARALAMEPQLLLMDEPFSSLDAMTRERLQNTILQTWHARRLTTILVTHNVEEAVFLGQRILVLDGRPATVSAIIENHGFGQMQYRLENAFFDTVKQVRRAMR